MTLFLTIDQLGLVVSAAVAMETLRGSLAYFESMVIRAKNDPDNVDAKFVEYLDAAAYGSSDKEKRFTQIENIDRLPNCSIISN